MSKIKEVKELLSDWRLGGKRGKEIPKEIKEEILKLVDYYSPWELQKLLGINSQSIKKWSLEKKKEEKYFIELPITESKEKELLKENILLKISNTNCSFEGNLSLNNWYSVVELFGVLKQ